MISSDNSNLENNFHTPSPHSTNMVISSEHSNPENSIHSFSNQVDLVSQNNNSNFLQQIPMDFNNLIQHTTLQLSQQHTPQQQILNNSLENKKNVEEGEKKRQIRLQKNRQSAALSRQRKKEFIGNLQKEVNKLSQENSQYQTEINKLTTQNWENKIHIERLEKEILKLINENNELKSKLKELGVVSDKSKAFQISMNNIIPSTTNTAPTNLSTSEFVSLQSLISERVHPAPSILSFTENGTVLTVNTDRSNQHT